MDKPAPRARVRNRFGLHAIPNSASRQPRKSDQAHSRPDSIMATSLVIVQEYEASQAKCRTAIQSSLEMHANQASAESRELLRQHLHSAKFSNATAAGSHGNAAAVAVKIYRKATEESSGSNYEAEYISSETVVDSISDELRNQKVSVPEIQFDDTNNNNNNNNNNEKKTEHTIEPTRETHLKQEERLEIEAAQLAAETKQEDLRKERKAREAQVVSHYDSLDVSLTILRDRLAKLSTPAWANDKHTDSSTHVDKITEETEKIYDIQAAVERQEDEREEVEEQGEYNQNAFAHMAQHGAIGVGVGVGLEFMSDEDVALRTIVRKNIRALSRSLHVDERIELLDDLFRWTLRRHKDLMDSDTAIPTKIETELAALSSDDAVVLAQHFLTKRKELCETRLSTFQAIFEEATTKEDETQRKKRLSESQHFHDAEAAAAIDRAIIRREISTTKDRLRGITTLAEQRAGAGSEVKLQQAKNRIEKRSDQLIELVREQQQIIQNLMAQVGHSRQATANIIRLEEQRRSEKQFKATVSVVQVTDSCPAISAINMTTNTTTNTTWRSFGAQDLSPVQSTQTQSQVTVSKHSEVARPKSFIDKHEDSGSNYEGKQNVDGEKVEQQEQSTQPFLSLQQEDETRAMKQMKEEFHERKTVLDDAYKVIISQIQTTKDKFPEILSPEEREIKLVHEISHYKQMVDEARKQYEDKLARLQEKKAALVSELKQTRRWIEAKTDARENVCLEIEQGRKELVKLGRDFSMLNGTVTNAAAMTINLVDGGITSESHTETQSNSRHQKDDELKKKDEGSEVESGSNTNDRTNKKETSTSSSSETTPIEMLLPRKMRARRERSSKPNARVDIDGTVKAATTGKAGNTPESKNKGTSHGPRGDVGPEGDEMSLPMSINETMMSTNMLSALTPINATAVHREDKAADAQLQLTVGGIQDDINNENQSTDDNQKIQQPNEQQEELQEPIEDVLTVLRRCYGVQTGDKNADSIVRSEIIGDIYNRQSIGDFEKDMEQVASDKFMLKIHLGEVERALRETNEKIDFTRNALRESSTVESMCATERQALQNAIAEETKQLEWLTAQTKLSGNITVWNTSVPVQKLTLVDAMAMTQKVKEQSDAIIQIDADIAALDVELAKSEVQQHEYKYTIDTTREQNADLHSQVKELEHIFAVNVGQSTNDKMRHANWSLRLLQDEVKELTNTLRDDNALARTLRENAMPGSVNAKQQDRRRVTSLLSTEQLTEVEENTLMLKTEVRGLFRILNKLRTTWEGEKLHNSSNISKVDAVGGPDDSHPATSGEVNESLGGGAGRGDAVREVFASNLMRQLQLNVGVRSSSAKSKTRRSELEQRQQSHLQYPPHSTQQGRQSPHQHNIELGVKVRRESVCCQGSNSNNNINNNASLSELEESDRIISRVPDRITVLQPTTPLQVRTFSFAEDSRSATRSPHQSNLAGDAKMFPDNVGKKDQQEQHEYEQNQQKQQPQTPTQERTTSFVRAREPTSNSSTNGTVSVSPVHQLPLRGDLIVVKNSFELNDLLRGIGQDEQNKQKRISNHGSVARVGDYQTQLQQHQHNCQIVGDAGVQQSQAHQRVPMLDNKPRKIVDLVAAADTMGRSPLMSRRTITAQCQSNTSLTSSNSVNAVTIAELFTSPSSPNHAPSSHKSITSSVLPTSPMRAVRRYM